MIRSARGLKKGYAMVMFLLVMALLSTFTVVTVMAVDADRRESRQTLERTIARSSSQAAVDEFFARVAADQEYLNSLFVDTDPNTLPPHPGVGKRANGSYKWARFDGAQVVDCPSLEFDCFHVSLLGERLTTKASGIPEAVIVEVTARADCAGVEFQCTYTRFTQRLRNRQFFDHLYYTQFGTLDPRLYSVRTPPLTTPTAAENACGNRYAIRTNPENSLGPRGADCLEIAYQGESTNAGQDRRDIVRGPVFTNDDYVFVCGNPRFEGNVYVSGAGRNPGPAGAPWFRRAQEARPGDNCLLEDPALVSPAVYLIDQPDLTLPCLSQSSNPNGALNTRCTSRDEFFAATTARLRLQPSASGPVRIVLRQENGATVLDISGSNQDGTGVPLSSRIGERIVSVDGDLEISGALRGALSVFATGNITVPADLYYTSGSPDAEPNGRTYPAAPCTSTNQNASDLLGLNAEKSITINQLTGTITEGRPRCVDAVLLSLQSTVYVPNWDVAQPGYTSNAGNGQGAGNAVSVAPQLRLFGAIATRYQGVFGGFDSSNGRLVSGYRKNFFFDQRLRQGTIQAPYLVSPISLKWERLDVAELAPCAQSGVDPAFDATICGR